MSSNPAIQVLLALTRRLSGEPVLHEALQAVSDAALELLPGTHASVRVFDDSGRELLSAARSGEGMDGVPVRFKRGEGLAGWVAEHGQLARLTDAAQDPRFKNVPDQGFVIRSLLAVPLWCAGEVSGVLTASGEQAGLFTEEHEDLAQLLANCAAPSIDAARLRRLAMTDHLTLAYNHRHLGERLEQEISRASRHGGPLSLLLLDLDAFKAINDSRGHAAGDVALQDFARRLRESVRFHDVAFRRGGDEFVLIMPHADAEQADGLAERIRSRIADQPVTLADQAEPVPLTVSIGVATWDGLEDGAELEARADQAMYRAKQQGGNRVAR